MLHQRLIKAAGLSQHFLSGVDDPIFQAEQEIEVPQAEVGVQDNSAGALSGQGNAQIGGEGGLADTPFSRADQDRSRIGHGVPVGRVTLMASTDHVFLQP